MATTALGAEMGERIRQLRIARGWSQRDLARAAGIANPGMISYYELGERMPSYSTLIRLADTFHVTIDYLLRGSNSNHITVTGLSYEAIAALTTIISEIKQNST